MAGLIAVRKPGQEMIINGNSSASIVVRVLEVRGQCVRLQIEAPSDVTIDRREIHDRKIAG